MPTNLLDILLIPIRSVLFVLALVVGHTYQGFTKINRRLAGISLTERANHFPAYTSSTEEYLEVRGRVEDFISTVLNSQPAELCLSNNDLNCLRVVRGKLESKRESFGKAQEFYEITEAGVIERRFVDPFANKYGFLDRAILISYETIEGSIFEVKSMIEEYGRALETVDSATRKFPMKQSMLLFLVLTKDKSAMERDIFVKVVESLREISTRQDELCLKAL